MSKSIPMRAILLFFIATAAASYGAEKSRLVTNLESGKKQQVVAYGTSLTENGAWVKQVSDALNNSFPGLVTVVNSGGSGKWSKWGVENLDQRVIQKKPDTVFIEFSINDSVARFKGSTEIAKINLEIMIDRILKGNSKCEIILMTMTPGNKYPKEHRSFRKDIEAHYKMYRSVAKQRGFLLIDHYPNWITLQSEDTKLFQRYVPDTIHPTATGCSEVVTPVILDALGAKSTEQKNAPDKK
jgi:acyl-CoA thioesterase I